MRHGRMRRSAPRYGRGSSDGSTRCCRQEARPRFPRGWTMEHGYGFSPCDLPARQTYQSLIGMLLAGWLKNRRMLPELDSLRVGIRDHRTHTYDSTPGPNTPGGFRVIRHRQVRRYAYHFHRTGWTAVLPRPRDRILDIIRVETYKLDHLHNGRTCNSPERPDMVNRHGLRRLHSPSTKRESPG